MKEFIIIHHSLTKDNNAVSWEAIRKFHMSPEEFGGLGARDIGYHFGLELINGKVEILFGRMPDEKGAHCKDLDMNSRGIGICCVGNYDTESPSLELWEKLANLVSWLRQIYNIPAENVLGHGEVQIKAGVMVPKSCPGKLFNMKRFREFI